MSFHEVRFPASVSRGASGGPERRTEIVVLGSGHEQRNARWAGSRRRYNAGYGVRGIDDIHAVIAFFEARRGRLHGFRWKDHADCKSCVPSQTPDPTDQAIGVGTGSQAEFEIVKRYGEGDAAYLRRIAKPVSGTLRVAVDGVPQSEGSDYTADYAAGTVTFLPGHLPPAAAQVTCGYEFDVPARFDSDRLEINIESVVHGSIPNIAIVEIRT